MFIPLVEVARAHIKMPNKKKVKVSLKKTKKRQSPSIPPPMPVREASMLKSLGALALRGAGGLGGAILGNPAAGYNAGAGISKWLGMGDYSLTQNSVIEKAAKGVPFMHKSGQTTRIQHREFISDVVASSTVGSFFNQQFPINPGQALTFPWLATVAQQYQEYEFKGLVFHYISTSGESVASTNTALGSVIMATQYRSTALPFTTKVGMLNEYFSTDSKPSEDFCHPVECDPRENPFQVQYVRTGIVPFGEDEKMYDLGTLNLATVGYPSASANLGELWVTYDIELRKPQLGTSNNIQDAHYTGNGTYNTANAFGTVAPSAVFDNIGLSISILNKTITFPSNTQNLVYMVTLVYQGTTAYTGNGFTFTTNSNSLNIYRGVGAWNSNYTVGTGPSTTTQFIVTNNVIPGAAPVVTFNAPAVLNAATALDIYVVQLNTNAQ